MSDTVCSICHTAIAGPKTLWEYKGVALWLCAGCAALPLDERHKRLSPRLKQIDQEAKQRAAGQVKYRTDIREEQLEELLVHAFLDLIGERKAKGRPDLAATQETIAIWLSDRTRLKVTAQHVQYMTLALRDGLIISVGGGGIGRPNSYDTREREMGLDAFWDQVDAFLLVWRIPGRTSLLLAE
ncbi:MAG TPA: hypothetical protein VD902_19115 [Symbiobacteriaceae bacterium]|nr:hypothetical protein [Symbiobacteriaceae bacterium]